MSIQTKSAPIDASLTLSRNVHDGGVHCSLLGYTVEAIMLSGPRSHARMQHAFACVVCGLQKAMPGEVGERNAALTDGPLHLYKLFLVHRLLHGLRAEQDTDQMIPKILHLAAAATFCCSGNMMVHFFASWWV